MEWSEPSGDVVCLIGSEEGLTATRDGNTIDSAVKEVEVRGGGVYLCGGREGASGRLLRYSTEQRFGTTARDSHLLAVYTLCTEHNITHNIRREELRLAVPPTPQSIAPTGVQHKSAAPPPTPTPTPPLIMISPEKSEAEAEAEAEASLEELVYESVPQSVDGGDSVSLLKPIRTPAKRVKKEVEMKRRSGAKLAGTEVNFNHPVPPFWEIPGARSPFASFDVGHKKVQRTYQAPPTGNLPFGGRQKVGSHDAMLWRDGYYLASPYFC